MEYYRILPQYQEDYRDQLRRRIDADEGRWVATLSGLALVGGIISVLFPAWHAITTGDIASGIFIGAGVVGLIRGLDMMRLVKDMKLELEIIDEGLRKRT